MFRQIWAAIKDSELYFQLFSVKTPNVHFEGNCKMTGNCCRALMLGYRFRAIKNLKEFAKEKRRNPHYEMFVPHEESYPDGFLRFHCSKLTGDHRCSIHETRPEMCRRYPDPIMVRYGASLLPGCGYRMVSDVKFDDYLGEELVKLKRKNRS